MPDLDKYYKTRTPDGMKWLVYKDFRDDFPVKIPSHKTGPDCVFLQSKSGRSSLIMKNGWPGKGDILVKEYWPRAWLEYIKYLFKRTRAETEWTMNHLLCSCDLPTATPIAWGEKRLFGIWKKSVLITKAISPCETLYDYLKDGHDIKIVRCVIDQLAEYVALLHNKGLHYRDLHGENILLETTDELAPKICFVDLHEVNDVVEIQDWMCIDDLGRLNGYIYSSASNRIRFLKKYLQKRNVAMGGWKGWARDIDARTKEIWARHRRKRGVLIDKYGSSLVKLEDIGSKDRAVLFLDKVLISPYKKAPRGVEVFNLNLIKDMIQSEYKVSAIIHESWREVVLKWVGDSNVELISIVSWMGSLCGSLEASFSLKRRKFSVLLLANVANRLIPALSVLRLLKVAPRSVCIAHREPSERFLKGYKKWKTIIVAVNHKIAGHFINNKFPSVEVKYGVTNGESFYPAESSVKEDTIDFCVIGHLDTPWKGADTAIAAFRSLPEDIRSKCRLHLASYQNPPSFSDDTIITHSWMSLSDVAGLLRRMDVMLVPSRDEEVMRETFSQAMVQGMLSGLPIIVNDLPILNEKLDQGGGIICENIEAFVSGMTKLASDPELRKSMGVTARKTALERYIWNTNFFIDEFLFPEKLDERESKMLKERTTINTHSKVAALLFEEKDISKVLDIPCGQGAFTKRLIDNGYKAYAGDICNVIDVTEAEFTVSDMGERLDFKDGELDAVVCIDGIEHIQRPFDFIKECRRVVSDEGTLIISTPNITALRSRWRWMLTGFHNKGKRPLEEDRPSPDHHIGLLSLPMLRYMLHTNGFSIKKITANRVKLISWIYLLWVPFLFVATWWVFSTEEKELGQRKRNKEIIRQMFSLPVLLGETLIVKAVKKD